MFFTYQRSHYKNNKVTDVGRLVVTSGGVFESIGNEIVLGTLHYVQLIQLHVHRHHSSGVSG